MRGPRSSLATRMVVVFSGLLAGIGAFMIAFFPRGMAAQAERSTEHRATSIVKVMSTAVAPAIEFEDPDHATQILEWLDGTPDAQFAVVLRADGQTFASWHAERIPRDQVWPKFQQVSFGRELLVVSVPVAGLAGGTGSLHVGFSLRDLEREREALTRTVTIVSALVVLVGVLATLIATTLFIRPIRRITSTAQQIARGELEAELPAMPGHDEIADMARALRAMLERVHERGQQELLRASRHAGMAEVATGVLHNVGNVLNSVNVTIELLHERLRATPVERLRQMRHSIAEQDPATFDVAKVTALKQFIEMLLVSSDEEVSRWATELDTLRGHVDHIKRVVAMQNAYARQGGVVETTKLRSLIDEAIEIACPRRAQLTLEIDAPDCELMFDRHRVLQTLVNLIANARDSLAAADGDKRITIKARRESQRLVISVTDSGGGFSPETAARLFGAGFTTKPTGHGYGLHSSALSMRQLGGDLTASSVGVGKGATFTLVLPLAEEATV